MAARQWLYVRVFVPVFPILLQYFFMAMGLYEPPFPQVTFLTMGMALAIVTIPEWRSYRRLAPLCLGPTGLAMLLYVGVLWSDAVGNVVANNRILFFGFALWLLLVIINLSMVVIGPVRSEEGNGR